MLVSDTSCTNISQMVVFLYLLSLLPGSAVWLCVVSMHAIASMQTLLAMSLMPSELHQANVASAYILLEAWGQDSLIAAQG